MKLISPSNAAQATGIVSRRRDRLLLPSSHRQLDGTQRACSTAEASQPVSGYRDILTTVGSELFYAPTDPGQDPRHVSTLEPVWNLFDLTLGGRPRAHLNKARLNATPTLRCDTVADGTREGAIAAPARPAEVLRSGILSMAGIF